MSGRERTEIASIMISDSKEVMNSVERKSLVKIEWWGEEKFYDNWRSFRASPGRRKFR